MASGSQNLTSDKARILSTTPGSAYFWRGDNTWSNILTDSLYLTRTTDLSGTADNRPALIIGNIEGQHLELDGNEIHSKASETTTSTLYLNYEGGLTHCGGMLQTTALGITNTDSTTGLGLSLYNGAINGAPTYGIMFAGTDTFGTHGSVSSNWATYFTMSDHTTRGWIFRRGTTNVASISGGGVVDINALKLHQGAAANPSLTGNARIEFDYSGGQPVVISYTPNDSYRSPAGLKIMGGTGASPAWLEVEGQCACTWLRVINNSSQNSDDAMVYLENKNSSDWAMKINCDGYDYGLQITCKTDSTYALSITGRQVIDGKIYISQPAARRDNGIVGTYDYTKAAAIWAMGASYQIAANGSGLGSLYGAAYGYQGQSYLGSNNYASGHQFLWCQNGTVYVALGNNIWARNNITAGTDITAGRYLYCTYVNESCGTETPSTSSNWIYANSDGWLRKSTNANVGAALSNQFLHYNGWWTSGNGSSLDNANGMVFAYNNHGHPTNWGIVATFDYQKDSAYRLQLAGGGYDNTLWFRNRSSDRGGWYTGWQRVVTNSGTWSISITGNAASATKVGVAAIWMYPNNSNEVNFGGTYTGNGYIYFGYRATDSRVVPTRFYFGGSGTAEVYAGKVHNAVWNDFAEYRKVDINEPGRVVIPSSTGTANKSTARLQAGGRIISDTFGCAVGKSNEAKTPLGMAGRVLAYPYRPIEEYQIGDCVCTAPNGTVDIMTRDEIKEYPDRIIGIVNEIPTYEIWEQKLTNDDPNKPDTVVQSVKVKGRIWIDIK